MPIYMDEREPEELRGKLNAETLPPIPEERPLHEALETLFPGRQAMIDKRVCPTCKNDITPFRDKLSEKEYSISGMCQTCQDKVFR